MNYQPLVSIIVPVYNSESTIGQCIRSLLAQEYPSHKLEIIVVDNNSTDGTAAIIRSYPVHYLKESTCKNSYVTRNRGIRHAKGDILAFTDGDCIANAGWIREGVIPFKAAEVGGVIGEIATDAPSSLLEHALYDHAFLGSKHCSQNPFLPYAQTANAFFRRSALTHVGQFDSTFISGGDADLSWRLQLHTGLSLVFAPKALVYHEHRKSTRAFWAQRVTHGRGKADLELKYAELMKKKGIKPEILKGDWTIGIQIVRYLLYRACCSLFHLLIFKARSAVGEWIFLSGEIAFQIGFLRRKQQLKLLVTPT